MELLVYKASAGSGKTFTLAVEYIKLLILNPRAYRQILAVTFTNKATAEMKERILSQLYGIWKGDKDSDAYLKRIIAETGKPVEEVREAAKVALTNMLHDYSRFRVETIDSFFQSVMRNLARELELSPNLNIELNNQEVLSDAVDSMIEKLGPTSPVLAWLLDYINERIADDKRWNVSDEVKSFGRNIFDEGYIEKGEGLRQKLIENPGLIKNYRRELKEMETEALEQMKGFYDQFEGELDGHALNADDLKNGSRGIGSYFRKLNNGILGDDIRNATVEKCLTDEKNWAAKSSPRYQDILQLASGSLMPLLNEAEKFRSKNNKIVNSCRLSMQHLNKVQLLANIDEEVRRLNRENNRFLLSDTNALLHQLVKDGDSSFVFEKIGTNIRNVMIDEFQDTSRMQWGNFRLLLLEGLSQGADSLIVGDVKQSIYRWRNGDWGILNGLNDRIEHFPIRVETLKTNRRSETDVIRFNNEIFTSAVNYLNAVYKEELKTDCEALQKAYSDVAQESPKEEKKGYVKVSFLEPDEEHDYTEQTLIGLGEEVERLQNSGVKLNDIAILVRKNKSIPRIADYFDKTLQYKIVSDEAFRLDASLAICMMIDALRYLSDPENRIARASLITNYQLQIKGYEGSLDNLLTAPAETLLPEAFIKKIGILRLMPLYELLEELFSLFEMNRISDQDAYLFAFFDAVTDYLQSNSSELDGFIRFWEETLCGKTIPSGEMEGIRIFSIHKSKGLEFTCVFIIGVNDGLLPLRGTSFDQEEEERRLFFVGMTRAKEQLELSYYTSPDGYGILPGPGKYLKMFPKDLIEGLDEPKYAEGSAAEHLQAMKRQILQAREERTLQMPEEDFRTISPEIDVEKPDTDPCRHEEKEENPAKSATNHTDADSVANQPRLAHEKYGVGTVISENEDTITIRFDDYGEKELLKMFTVLHPL